MECNSVHSTIERSYAKIDVYHPNQYTIHSIAARKNPMQYRSKLLNHTYFNDFSKD